MHRQEELNKIYNTFGFKAQLKKLYEELGELTTAIQNMDRINIMEEIADVKIMVDQFYLNHTLVQTNYNEKIDRTIKRIEEKYYKI